LAVQYAIGSIMPHIGRKTLNEGWVNWHFSVGAAILFFIVIRVVWRLLHPVPQPASLSPVEDSSPAWCIGRSNLLILAMTLLGWAATKFARLGRQAVRSSYLAKNLPHRLGMGHECGDIHNVLVLCSLGFILLHCCGCGLALFPQARSSRWPHAILEAA